MLAIYFEKRDESSRTECLLTICVECFFVPDCNRYLEVEEKNGLLEFGYLKVVKKRVVGHATSRWRSRQAEVRLKAFNHFDGSIITAECCFDNFYESTSINFDCRSKHIATVRFYKVVVDVVKITTVGDRHSDLLPTNRFWFPFIRPNFKLRILCRLTERNIERCKTQDVPPALTKAVNHWFGTAIVFDSIFTAMSETNLDDCWVPTW